MIRVGFSARPRKSGLKNPRPDGLGEYRRTIDIIKACAEWGLTYYNMPPETVGWGDYSKYRPDAAEVERAFAGLLTEIRMLSKGFDIKLSFHIRSSAVLTSPDNTIRERSIREVLALRRALELVDGLIVYVHPGYAHGDEAAAVDRLVTALNKLPVSPVMIGLETNDVGIGDLATILTLCEATHSAVPVVDWAHLLGGGYLLQQPEDYLAVIDTVDPYWSEYAYFHFSAVLKRKHLPLDHKSPDYRIFAQALRHYAQRSDKDAIVLIESPLREQDALLFQRAVSPR